MFKQARQNRAFEDVTFQIQESILQGSLKEGDRLPSERNLREIFKVSRGTLREALRALEQQNLIQIRTGVNGGAFVCKVDTRHISESLDLLLRYQKISLNELREFREIIEPLVAEKAAQKATKGDLAEVERILKSIKSSLIAGENNWAEIVNEDIRFHSYLSHIAGNRVFESVLSTIYGNIIRYFEQFLPKDKTISQRTYKDLVRIYDAMKVRDSDRVKTIAASHVRYFNRTMERKTRRR